MAPEVCDESIEYTSKCDVWSIGVIAFMLFSGKAPFYGNSNVEIWNMAQKGPVFKPSDWKNVSPEAKKFVARLLTVDQKKRPSCAEALEDPMLDGVK
jgi:calcium-dependent protein kinase